MVGVSPYNCCYLGQSLRHASFMVAVFSPLGEYLGTMVKFEPLAKSDSHASVRGDDGRLTTHLALILSTVDVFMLFDVVVVAVVIVLTVV